MKISALLLQYYLETKENEKDDTDLIGSFFIFDTIKSEFGEEFAIDYMKA